jgi:hypothetical protein
VLTKSFQHDFRREAAEFEPITVRVRIASHNRKFVTLAHEIHSEINGLLGRGEQSLMFVDTVQYRPLDIPRTIIEGFLPYWPKTSPHATLDGVGSAGSHEPQRLEPDPALRSRLDAHSFDEPVSAPVRMRSTCLARSARRTPVRGRLARHSEPHQAAWIVPRRRSCRLARAVASSAGTGLLNR